MRNNPWKTELKVARSQRNKLLTISSRLKEMCCEWDGVSGWLETESERLAESVDDHIKALEDQIREWAEGTDSREGF
jgi:SOS-response transcriptional repressor LexA